MRTLIAVLATAAISLPAAAQQTETGQGSRQYQGAQPQEQNMDQTNAGNQRATTGEQRGSRMGGTHQGYAAGQRSQHQFRGRAGYRESGRRYGMRGYGVRGRTVYGEYSRGPRYSYRGGRRIYAESCPRYIYINGRRVFNERCAGYAYLGGRRVYSYGYGRGPRYSSVERRRVFSTREYGTRRGGAYASGRVAGGARFSRGEAGRAYERRGAAYGGRGAGSANAQGQIGQNRSNRTAPGAGNRQGSQTQTEPQSGAR